MATKAGTKWTTDTVASLPLCNGCAQPGPTKIGVTPNGPDRGLRRPEHEDPLRGDEDRGGLDRSDRHRRRHGRRPRPRGGQGREGVPQLLRRQGRRRPLSRTTGPRGARRRSRTRRRPPRPWSRVAPPPRPPPRPQLRCPSPPATSPRRPAWRSTTTARSTSPGTTAPRTASCSLPATAPPSRPSRPPRPWTASTPPWRSRPTGPSSTWRGTASRTRTCGSASRATSRTMPSRRPARRPPAAWPLRRVRTCGEDGKVALDMSAQNIAFETNCLVAAAGTDFSINFDNKDPGVDPQHRRVQERSVRATSSRGASVAADPDQSTKLPAKPGPLDAGTYFFRCDAHPTSMFGSSRWSRPGQVAAGRPSRALVPGRVVGWPGERSSPGCLEHPRPARRLPLPRRRRTRRLRGQGPVAAQTPGQLLEPSAAPADRGDGERGRERRVDPRLGRGRRADARVQPDPAAQAAVQRPLPRRQVLPVPGAHGGGDVAARPGAARAPSARTSGTSVRTGTRGPSATRSTPSPGCSRSARAPTRSSTSARGPSGPASTTTSGGAPARACRRSTGVTEESYRAQVDALADFLAGNTRPVLARLDRADARVPRRSRSTSRPRSSATSSRAARRAMEAQEMVLSRPEDLDVIGMAEDDLEAAFQVFFVRGGPGAGAQGLGRRPGGGPRRGRSSWRRSSGSSTWSARRSRRGCWCPTQPDGTRGAAGLARPRAAATRVDDRGAGARRQAQARWRS